MVYVRTGILCLMARNKERTEAKQARRGRSTPNVMAIVDGRKTMGIPARANVAYIVAHAGAPPRYEAGEA